MCDVLLNVAFSFMCDLIFANSSSHEIKVTVKISRYMVYTNVYNKGNSLCTIN